MHFHLPLSLSAGATQIPSEASPPCGVLTETFPPPLPDPLPDWTVPEPALGKVLILASNVNLVLSLRLALLQSGYQLVWSSNFWVAMSYLHHQPFSALILDMGAPTVEEKFIPDFIDEFQSVAGKRCVLLAAPSNSPGLLRGLREHGHLLLENRRTAAEIAVALSLFD